MLTLSQAVYVVCLLFLSMMPTASCRGVLDWFSWLLFALSLGRNFFLFSSCVGSQNSVLKATSAQLEVNLQVEREENVALRRQAAQPTSSCGCGPLSVRGGMVAPAPISEDEMDELKIEMEPVERESAVLAVSQPQKRCASPTSSMVLLMACLR